MSDAPDFTPNTRERDTSIPRFYMEPFKNEAKSAAMGQPVFEEREMVEILIPGDRLTVVSRIVGEEQRRRWPEHYKAFKAGLEAPLDGTPVEQLPGITAARVEELRFAHVRSIETLANLTDAQLAKAVSMGGQTLREQAKRWLEAAAGAAPAEKLAAENAELKATIDQLQKTTADLASRLDAMSAQKANSPDPSAPPPA